MSNTELEGAEASAEATNKGVVPAGYAQKMKGREKTWLDGFIDEQAKEVTGEESERKIALKDDEGNPQLDDEGEQLYRVIKTKPKASINSENLLKLAAANGIPEDVLAKYEQLNAGMQRMNIGNRLRAKARKQHGLFDIDGNEVSAPADFLESLDAPEEPTHNMDGTKIPVAKPEKADKEAA
jgi:hypothetical protein